MQIIIFGIISGLSIALVAIALQAVYLPTRVLFIGLAGIYILAPYVAAMFMDSGYTWWLAILLSIVICIVVSILCEVLNHGPLNIKSNNYGLKKGLNETAHLISSLGIYIVVSQIVVVAWGTKTKTLPISTGTVTYIGDIFITKPQWIILIASIFMISAFILFLNKTDIGLSMRAMVNNPRAFGLLGYNIKLYRIVFFGLAGLFASASSLLLAYSVGFNPYFGMQAILIALVAIIIGGQDSFMGAILGALLLGVLRELIAWHYTASWTDGISFFIFACFLFLRPQGILGKSSRLENSI